MPVLIRRPCVLKISRLRRNGRFGGAGEIDGWRPPTQPPSGKRNFSKKTKGSCYLSGNLLNRGSISERSFLSSDHSPGCRMGHSGNSFAPPFDYIRSRNIAVARRPCSRSATRHRRRFRAFQPPENGTDFYLEEGFGEASR